MNSAHDDALLAAWQKTLARNAERAAIFDTTGGILRSFSDIELESQQLATALLSAGKPQQVFAIEIGQHESWPAILLACLRAQVVVVPLESTLSPSQRDAAFGVCRATAVVSADANGRLEISRLSAANTLAWDGNVPALLKLTSGTTAAPRAIRFRSAQLLADCENICDTMGISAVDVNFGAIPVSHSYGFSNLITPLIVRGVPLVLSHDRMPRAILEALARTDATVFPGMPVFHQAICELADAPQLPALRLCISAGAPLPLALAKKFRESFGLPIHSFYGSSECGGICYDREARLEQEGFVGSAMKGVEIEHDKDIGQIRVRSAVVADGYFPEPEEEQLGHGVFVPDDLLEKSGSGFRIVGRISDVINVAGKKVHPAEIEAVLLCCCGVQHAIVFGRKSAARNEEVAACVIANHGTREPQLLEHCRAHLSSWQVPKRIFFVDAIPVNERGKISRRELAERFR